MLVLYPISKVNNTGVRGTNQPHIFIHLRRYVSSKGQVNKNINFTRNLVALVSFLGNSKLSVHHIVMIMYFSNEEWCHRAGQKDDNDNV